MVEAAVARCTGQPSVPNLKASSSFCSRGLILRRKMTRVARRLSTSSIMRQDNRRLQCRQCETLSHFSPFELLFAFVVSLLRSFTQLFRYRTKSLYGLPMRAGSLKSSHLPSCCSTVQPPHSVPTRPPQHHCLATLISVAASFKLLWCQRICPIFKLYYMSCAVVLVT